MSDSTKRLLRICAQLLTALAAVVCIGSVTFLAVRFHTFVHVCGVYSFKDSLVFAEFLTDVLSLFAIFLIAAFGVLMGIRTNYRRSR